MKPGISSKRRFIINTPLAFFILFLVIYTIHNVAYLRINTGFDCLEQSLYNSVQRFYLVYDDPLSFLNIAWQSIGPDARERSLYDLFCWPFFLLFGVSSQTAVYPNFFWLFLLTFSVYKIGGLAKNKEVGCLAAFQVLMYPAIFGFTRIYFTAIATTSLVSLGIYCFLSSGLFKSTGKTLLFVVCLIVLTKLKMEKSFIYVFLPVALYLSAEFRHNVKRGLFSGRRRFNIIAGIVMFLLLFFILFKRGFTSGVVKYYFLEVKGFSSVLRTGEASFGAGEAAAYIKDLFFIQLGHLGSLLFVFAIPYFLKSRSRFKPFFVYWIFVPYAVHIVYYYFSGIHSAYYTVQYLPAFALISSCGIYRMVSSKGDAFKKTVYSAVVVLSLLNYVFISHYNRQLPLLRLMRGSSFTGKTCFIETPGEDLVFTTAQRLTEALLAVDGSAHLVLADHYPSLHWLYGKMLLNNSIGRSRVSVYDYSCKVFSLEPPDSAAVLSSKFRCADLIIDGNKMYPVELSSGLKHYCQFGAFYDFSGVMKNEENEYNKKLPDMEKVASVIAGRDKVDFWISRAAREKFFAKTGKDIRSVDRKELTVLARRFSDTGSIKNSKIEICSRSGENIIRWGGRELLLFGNLNDRSFSAFPPADVLIEKPEGGELVISEEYEGVCLKQIWTVRLEDRAIYLKLEIETGDARCLEGPFITFRRKVAREWPGVLFRKQKKRDNRKIFSGGFRRRFFEYESAANRSGLDLNMRMASLHKVDCADVFGGGLLKKRYDGYELYLLLHGSSAYPASKVRITYGKQSLTETAYFGIAPDSGNGNYPGVIIIPDVVLLNNFFTIDGGYSSSGDITFLINSGGRVMLEPVRLTVFSGKILICGTEEDYSLELEKLKPGKDKHKSRSCRLIR